MLFFIAQLGGAADDCGVKDHNQSHPCPDADHTNPAGMFAAVIGAHVDFDTAGIGSGGLEALSTELCYAKGSYMQCPDGRNTQFQKSDMSNLSNVACTVLECNGGGFADVLVHDSYIQAIKQLWDMKSGAHAGRPAAACLFAFSFIWPHVKLLLLHVFFYLPLPAGKRRNGLYWFSFFGKWSLADVLMMACVVGLFNLQKDLSLVQTWDQLQPNFRTLCDVLCPVLMGMNVTNGTATPPACTAGCELVEGALNKGLTPEMLPSSNVGVNLTIVGLEAMYAFCFAVVVSLTAGVWVDALDDTLREELFDEEERINTKGDARLVGAFTSTALRSTDSHTINTPFLDAATPPAQTPSPAAGTDASPPHPADSGLQPLPTALESASIGERSPRKHRDNGLTEKWLTGKDDGWSRRAQVRSQHTPSSGCIALRGPGLTRILEDMQHGMGAAWSNMRHAPSAVRSKCFVSGSG